jgi:UDP-N-acetylmuramoyl-L-alanyl-D-glutamate--2,6-diaminopimelate ligase
MNPKKLVRKVLPKKGIKLAEESYRKGRIYALQARHGFPAKGARVIAITGTNGKTTTCLIVNEMLKAAGYKTAMFTTAVWEMDGAAIPNTNHRTVPLTADLMRFFKQAKAKKVDFIVMETTSQALHQHKMVGIPVEVAAMTNLTQDHLDYHKTMENYAAAKARLFSDYMNPNYCVLNADDEWFEYFAKQSVGQVSTYGKAAGNDVSIQSMQATAGGGEAKVTFGGETTLTLKTHLVGAFNVINTVTAAAVGHALGIEPQVIAKGVNNLPAAPGRMEQIDAGQNFNVIVDYAHAPDALENVLKTLKNVTKGKVLLVFGATGDRDKLKRPIMGDIAAKHADRIFLTDDETYTEDPATIRASVMEGIKKGKGTAKTTEIGDRKEAIKAAFKEAKKGDAVLLAGLGHQDYRAMAGKKITWDERQVARDLLKQR